MIQPPFNSSCAALQRETGTKFFHCYFTTYICIQTNDNTVFLGNTRISSYQWPSWRLLELSWVSYAIITSMVNRKHSHRPPWSTLIDNWSPPIVHAWGKGGGRKREREGGGGEFKLPPKWSSQVNSMLFSFDVSWLTQLYGTGYRSTTLRLFNNVLWCTQTKLVSLTLIPELHYLPDTHTHTHTHFVINFNQPFSPDSSLLSSERNHLDDDAFSRETLKRLFPLACTTSVNRHLSA
jgi:hypothetical protein